MSLSKLGSQLASISNNGTVGTSSAINAGIILPSNKRHSDNIGKGINYSVNRQQQNTNKVQYKASILYNTARDAADVPIRIIQETAIQSIQQIRQQCIIVQQQQQQQQSKNTTMIKFVYFDLLNDIEYKLLSNNNNTDTRTTNNTKLIQQTLVLCSVLLGSINYDDSEKNSDDMDDNNSNQDDDDSDDDEDNDNMDETEDTNESNSVTTGSNIIPHVINIIEYLIRQYNIQETFASELLWVFLPYHDMDTDTDTNSTNHNMKRYLARTMELIDLTGTVSSISNTYQSYLWLRKYVAINTAASASSSTSVNSKSTSTSDSTIIITVPSRTIIVHNCITSIHIVRTICQLVQTIISLVDVSSKSKSISTSSKSLTLSKSKSSVVSTILDHGISYWLSFTAAILIEGCSYIQTHYNSTNNITTNSKFTCDYILSFIRTIQPIVLHSCKLKNYSNNVNTNNIITLPVIYQQYTTWGYMISSTIQQMLFLVTATTATSLSLSKSTLRQDYKSTIELYCTTIYVGIRNTNYNHSSSITNGSNYIIDAAITTILAMLLPTATTTTTTRSTTAEMTKSSSWSISSTAPILATPLGTIIGIPILSSYNYTTTTTTTRTKMLLGCPIPIQLWNAIIIGNNNNNSSKKEKKLKKQHSMNDKNTNKNNNNDENATTSTDDIIASCTMLSSSLGRIYNDHNVIIEPFVVALLTQCTNNFHKYHYTTNSINIKTAATTTSVSDMDVDVENNHDLVDETNALWILTKSLLTEPIISTLLSNSSNNNNSNNDSLELIASLVSYIILNRINNDLHDSENDNLYILYSRQMLRLLVNIDEHACERGVAYALQQYDQQLHQYQQQQKEQEYTSTSIPGSTKKSKTIMTSKSTDSTTSTDSNKKSFHTRTRKILDGIVTFLVSNDTDNCDDEDNGKNKLPDTTTTTDKHGTVYNQTISLLPVRIALDDPNENIRLHAIARITDSITNSQRMQQEQSMSKNDAVVVQASLSPSTTTTIIPITSQLLEQLIMKWSTDPSIVVATAACTLLSTILVSTHYEIRTVVVDTINSNYKTFGELALTGCYRTLVDKSFLYVPKNRTNIDNKSTTSSADIVPNAQDELHHTYTVSSIRSIGSIANTIGRIGKDESIRIWHLCVQYIVAHIHVKHTKKEEKGKLYNSIFILSEEAGKALLQAFALSQSYPTDSNYPILKIFVLHKSWLTSMEIAFKDDLDQQSSSSNNTFGTRTSEENNAIIAEQMIRKCCFWNIIQSVVTLQRANQWENRCGDDNLEEINNNLETTGYNSTTVDSTIISLCFYAITEPNLNLFGISDMDNNTDHDVVDATIGLYQCPSLKVREIMVRECFDICSRQQTILPNYIIPSRIIQIASIESDSLFTNIGLPIIQSIAVSVFNKQDSTAIREKNKAINVPNYIILAEAVTMPHISTIAKVRLLQEINTMVKSTPSSISNEAMLIVPCLSLMDDTSNYVHTAIKAIFITMATKREDKSKAKNADDRLTEIIQVISHGVSVLQVATVADESALLKVLNLCMQRIGSNKQTLQLLLNLCYYVAFALIPEPSSSLLADNDGSERKDSSWLPSGCATGGSKAAITILKAMEIAKENTFPLLQRWTYFGRPFLNRLMLSSAGISLNNTAKEDLIVHAIQMLKGVTVSDAKTVVTYGNRPGGGRTRTYSFDQSEGSFMLHPYPEKMMEFLIKIFDLAAQGKESVVVLAKLASDNVIHSKSWRDGVFMKLSKLLRFKLSQSYVSYAAAFSDVLEDETRRFPFDTSDVCQLLATTDISISGKTLVVTFIYKNSLQMQTDSQVEVLVPTLFKQLINIQSNKNDDDEDKINQVLYFEYMILTALKCLLEVSRVRTTISETNDSIINTWIAVMPEVIRGNQSERTQGSSLVDSRLTSLSLFVHLCHIFPEMAATQISNIVFIALDGAIKNEDDRIPLRVFTSLTPYFFKHAEQCSYPIPTFLRQFMSVAESVNVHKKRNDLYRTITHTMTKAPSPTNDHRIEIGCVSALVVMFLANSVFEANEGPVPSEDVDLAVGMINTIPVNYRLQSLMVILHFGHHLLVGDGDGKVGYKLLEVSIVSQLKSIMPSAAEVTEIASFGLSGSIDTTEKVDAKSSTTKLTFSVLQVFRDTLLSEEFEHYLSTQADSLSITLWQNVYATMTHARELGNDKYMDEGSLSMISAIHFQLEKSNSFLQTTLPSKLFLSTIATVFSDTAHPEVICQALSLLGNKVLTIGEPDENFGLYILAVHDILSLADNYKGVDNDKVLLFQSCLGAVEHIARAYRIHEKGVSTKDRSLAIQQFNAAIRLCSDSLLESTSVENGTLVPSDILCSAALCAATLIRAVGPHSVKYLPNLLQRFISTLEIVSNEATFTTIYTMENVKVIQLSVIEALSTCFEIVPQFLPTYFSQLYSPSCLLSKNLRQNSLGNKFDSNQSSIDLTLRKLDTINSTKVPFRLLVPNAIKATKLLVATSIELVPVTLAILANAIKLASNAEANTHKGVIMTTIKLVLSTNIDLSTKVSSVVVDHAVTVVQEVVLKLSEMELQRMYLSLLEWKGKIDIHDPSYGWNKRYAFWLLSRQLGKQLKSLFLPCLDIAFGDVVQELDLAVRWLCDHAKDHSEKNISGSKRRRLLMDGAGDEMKDNTPGNRIKPNSSDFNVVHILRPLLTCLEESLKCNSQDGKHWLHSDENKKCELLLHPLGKLLFARVGEEIVLQYQSIVEGSRSLTSDTIGSSVIECINALAQASGSEQLWKSINNVLLRACSDEKRPECRRAGLSCLLLNLRSIGEEYMFLLPEILPILAELVEDSSEDVANLAKQVANVASDLEETDIMERLR